MIIILAILYILFNECEDESIKSNWKRNQQFFNTNISWKNKWKLDEDGNLILNTKKHWYYFGFDPKYVERRYLSSTVLVFRTDGEHLFQFLKNLSILGAFFIISWKFGLMWLTGKIIGSIIKEKINWLQ